MEYCNPAGQSIRRRYRTIFNRFCQLDIFGADHVRFWQRCFSRVYNCNTGNRIRNSYRHGVWRTQRQRSWVRILVHGRPDRAEKSVWRTAFLNMIFLGIVTVLFFSLAGPILRYFHVR